MPRRVFYSFHFENDFWRVQQIRNIGAIEGNSPAANNRWEEIKQSGPDRVKRWIDANLEGKSCTIVLIGSETASRRWVKYEISRSWQLKKGVVGIRIHNLKNQAGFTAARGNSPFINGNIQKYNLEGIVKVYNPDSNSPYNAIKNNIENWIEEAIQIRSQYG